MTGEIRTLQAHTDLWAALRDMRIEAPGAERSFAVALADEEGWTPEHARAVDHEYRRFLFLAATAGTNVTPSKDVDRAWHLHLTYTRHYWDVLCAQILRRPLHHVPGEGGPEDEASFGSQYAATLSAYENAFGQPPPRGIWPRPADVPADEAAEPAAGWRKRIPALAGGTALVVSGAVGWGAAGFGIAMMTLVLLLIFLSHGASDAASERRAGGTCGSSGCGCGGD